MRAFERVVLRITWIRNFKGHTSKKLIEAIRDNPRERRKNWMLPLFQAQGQENARNKDFQLWKQGNHPEEYYSAAFTFQKINYIHENLVRAGIVENPWEYTYSSAIDYHKGKRVGLLEMTI